MSISCTPQYARKHGSILPQYKMYLEFQPERRLGDPKGQDGVTLLFRCIVSFGGVPAVCIYMNLTVRKLGVVRATVFRRHKIQVPGDIVKGW